MAWTPWILLLAAILPANEPRRQELLVSMRDGVELATDAYLPDGQGPWPAILSRTPYNKDGIRGLAERFVKQGYAVVAQDCRGKFKTKGSYDPFKTDHVDGYDTVEWIAGQGWSDGKVGMLGGSALGITTNLAATQVPPHLVCGYVIVAESSARRDTVYMGGVYRKELNDGWLMLQGAAFAIADTMRNPPGSSHWDWREIPAFHNRIRIPIYHVGGWFDIFTQGTIDNFVGLQAHGAGPAAGNQKLVMGPFAHGQIEGRLKFPTSESPALGFEEQLRWFDRWLKGSANGIDREPAVRYYMLGDPEDPEAPGNEWRDADSWPPSSRPTSYYLHPEFTLVRATPSENHGSIAYRYDPKEPVSTVGGANLILGGKGPMDQRQIGNRQDYLRFLSQPLKAPLEVAGRVTVDLFIASDAPDTDFAAKLVDVYPDGYEALLLDSIVRARYREGFDREVMLPAGEVVPVRIDLWSTAIAFNKGHRIGLHITSSNDPRFDPNPNTGHPQRADKETRPANNTIHFGGAYPSRLLLPVVKEYD
jgi:predicted acyl esterase